MVEGFFQFRNHRKVEVPTLSTDTSTQSFWCIVTFHLSSTPRMYWEIVEQQPAEPLHGSLTPTVVLTEPPNAVTRSRREYHYPPDCYGHTGSNPVLTDDRDRSLRLEVLADHLYWLMLSHIRFNVSTNDYSLFKVLEVFTPLLLY